MPVFLTVVDHASRILRLHPAALVLYLDGLAERSNETFTLAQQTPTEYVINTNSVMMCPCRLVGTPMDDLNCCCCLT